MTGPECRACPFPDQVAALELVRLREGGRASPGRRHSERGIDIALRPYRCVCGAWHLGHKDQRPKWLRRKAKR